MSRGRFMLVWLKFIGSPPRFRLKPSRGSLSLHGLPSALTEVMVLYPNRAAMADEEVLVQPLSTWAICAKLLPAAHRFATISGIGVRSHCVTLKPC